MAARVNFENSRRVKDFMLEPKPYHPPPMGQAEYKGTRSIVDFAATSVSHHRSKRPEQISSLGQPLSK
jgi:hypothetical protein